MRTQVQEYDDWYEAQSTYLQSSWQQIVEGLLCKLREGVSATDLAATRWSVVEDLVTYTKSPDPIKFAIAVAADNGEELQDDRGEFPIAMWKKLPWSIRVSRMEGAAIAELYNKHYTEWRYFEELWFLDPIKYSHLHDELQLVTPSRNQLEEIAHHWANVILTRVGYVDFPNRAYEQWLILRLRQPNAMSQLQTKLREFLETGI